MGKVAERKVGFFLKLALGLLFLGLIGISEFLYIVNNKPAYIYSYFLEDVRKSTNEGDFPRAAKSIENISNFLILTNSLKYKAPIPKIFPQPDNILKYPDLSEDYIGRLEGVNLENNSKHPDQKMGKIYYDWGLSAYKKGHSDQTGVFWQKAIYLNPELSTLQLELINFYLSNGNYAKAREQINFCQMFPGFPQEGCESYLNQNFMQQTPEKVGYLESEIEEHYRYR